MKGISFWQPSLHSNQVICLTHCTVQSGSTCAYICAPLQGSLHLQLRSMLSCRWFQSATQHPVHSCLIIRHPVPIHTYRDGMLKGSAAAFCLIKTLDMFPYLLRGIVDMQMLTSFRKSASHSQQCLSLLCCYQQGWLKSDKHHTTRLAFPASNKCPKMGS